MSKIDIDKFIDAIRLLKETGANINGIDVDKKTHAILLSELLKLPFTQYTLKDVNELMEGKQLISVLGIKIRKRDD